MKFQFRYLTRHETVLAAYTVAGDTFDACKEAADALAARVMRHPDYALCRAHVIEPERVVG